MKNNEQILKKEEEKEYFTTIEELLNEIKSLETKLLKAEENQEKLLKYIDELIDDYNFKIWKVLAQTGNITLDDIKYQNNFMVRQIIHKQEKLKEE